MQACRHEFRQRTVERRRPEETEAKTRKGTDKEKEMDIRRGAGEKSKVAALTEIAITQKSL